MKLIGFKNFRKFEDFPPIELDPITIFVGENNAGKSTLRKSLGSLWGYPFIYRDKNPNPSKTPKTKFRDEDEKAITQWMKKNLLVLFVANSYFETEEDELIEAFNPPLNLDKNRNVINMSYRMQIKRLRNRPVEE